MSRGPLMKLQLHWLSIAPTGTRWDYETQWFLFNYILWKYYLKEHYSCDEVTHWLRTSHVTSQGTHTLSGLLMKMPREALSPERTQLKVKRTSYRDSFFSCNVAVTEIHDLHMFYSV